MRKLPKGINNYEEEFGDQELISMLFYLGYLTISGELLGTPELKIPNRVMKELYAEYFLERKGTPQKY